MSSLRSLSIQSNPALVTPVDSHFVSRELRRSGATRTSIPSILFNTRASLRRSRQILNLRRALSKASELLWRRRRTRRSSFFRRRSSGCLVRWQRQSSPSLHLFQLAPPFGEALLHSLL